MTSRPAPIEPLEARIAPAIALQHPLPDLVAGPGKTGAVVDLSEMFDPAATSPNRTIVEFLTNFDTDANTPGIQAGVIRMELLDDLVPLTVQNFLTYVNNRNTKGDYDGTFFHRAVSGFVLQGGGFNSEGSREHIPTGLDLHNEFSPTRSNLRGTITMAKTGLSPNTATSEFFFNVADNSANLDSQNGGFTVFGQVVQGLDIVDAIVALPRQRIVGSFDAPVQNYTDPDGDIATLNPVPTADQLIRITDARVVPANVGNSTGITYSIASIFQAGTTTPSSLVTGKIQGASLNLAYRPGAAGAVDVVVRAVGPDGPLDTVSDTFRVTVQPNLLARIAADGLPAFLTAGDVGTVKVQLSNSGGGAARGLVDVRFSLAEVDPQTGNLVPSGAGIPLGLLNDQAINIAGGASTTLAARIQVPTSLLANTTKTYRLVAEVEPVGVLATQELFSDDNASLNGAFHQVLNQFGSFNTRVNVPLTYVESDGDRVTFALTGGGFARLTLDASGQVDLSVSNTTAASRLGARVAKAPGGDGRIDLNDLNFSSVLNSVALGLADVDGSVAAGGGLRALTLGNLSGPGTLSLSALLPANTTAATVKLGRVSDFDFEPAMPVASLTAVEWLDTGGLGEELDFYSLGRLAITGARGIARGDLQADVHVSSNLAVSGFSVAGMLDGAKVTVAGDIGSVVVGAIRGSQVFAGTTLRPTTLGDFSAERTISQFTVRGIAGFVGDLFIDSQVAAQNFGRISVQQVTAGNSGSVFGFVADAIRSYNRAGGARLAGLDTPANLDVATDYRLAIL